MNFMAVLVLPPDNRKTEYKEDGVHVDLKVPVKHVLSRELQVNLDQYDCVLFAHPI